MSGLTKEQRVLYNQLQNAIGDFVEGFAKGFNDKMKEKHDVVKFDGTPPEDKQMLFDELGDFVESFAKGFNDKMKEKHEIETKQVTNKAIGIGITCGVIAALAVGIGCVVLPVLNYQYWL